MRFKEYLNENAKFDIEQFKKDCAYYFEQMGDKHGLLMHGSKSAPRDFEIQTFKERGGPRDSPNILHTKVNELFQKRFGYPFRNGLFTTGGWGQAANYGPVSIIFPIGKFEWLSTPYQDLTSEYEIKLGKIRNANPELDFDERAEIATDLVIKELESSTEFFHNTDLPTAISYKYEIMIKCDKFYSVSEHGDAWEAISKYLNTIR